MGMEQLRRLVQLLAWRFRWCSEGRTTESSETQQATSLEHNQSDQPSQQ